MSKNVKPVIQMTTCRKYMSQTHGETIMMCQCPIALRNGDSRCFFNRLLFILLNCRCSTCYWGSITPLSLSDLPTATKTLRCASYINMDAYTCVPVPVETITANPWIALIHVALIYTSCYFDLDADLQTWHFEYIGTQWRRIRIWGRKRSVLVPTSDNTAN